MAAKASRRMAGLQSLGMRAAPLVALTLGLGVLAACADTAPRAAATAPAVTPAAVRCPAAGRPAMGFALYPGRLMALASGRRMVAPYDAAVAARSDLLSFHWDNNVPWALLQTCGPDLDGCAPPRRLRTAHQRQQAFFDDALKTMTAQRATRYVALSPLDIERKRLSVAFEAQQGVRGAAPPGASFGDEAVRRQYLDFVRYAATKFRPAYFSPGIEINMYAESHAEDFANLLSLMEEARDLVHSIDPAIVVAPSLQWEFFKRDWNDAEIRPLLEELVARWPGMADGVFVSTYPTVLGNTGAVSGADYDFAAYGLTGRGPLLIAEAGTQPALQRALLDTLVDLGETHDLRGIVWFLVQDMDRLNIPVPGLRDIGLFDDSRRTLRAHPGAAVWDGYRACPRRRG